MRLGFLSCESASLLLSFSMQLVTVVDWKTVSSITNICLGERQFFVFKMFCWT